MNGLAVRECDHDDCIWVGIFVGPRAAHADTIADLHALETHGALAFSTSAVASSVERGSTAALPSTGEASGLAEQHPAAAAHPPGPAAGTPTPACASASPPS